jgi:hypothetical protein
MMSAEINKSRCATAAAEAIEREMALGDATRFLRHSAAPLPR